MTRSISPQMRLHIDQELMTLSVCVRLIPKKEARTAPLYMTEHDSPLVIDGNAYSPKVGFNLSAIQTSTDYSSDNTEVAIGQRSREDTNNFIDAEVYIFYVNWEDLSMGKISLFTGYVSTTKLDEDDTLRLTVSGLGKKLSKRYLPRYSRTCRAALGDSKCGVPNFPSFKLDTFESFPSTIEVGEQKVPLSNITGLLPVPLFNNSAEFNRDAALSDGDFIFYSFTSSLQADVHLQQINSDDEVIQDVWEPVVNAGAHNLSTFLLPLATKLKVTTSSALTSETLEYTSNQVISSREKLSRVTSDNHLDNLSIPNGQFYKDGAINLTSNPTTLSDWEVVSTVNGYAVSTGTVFSSTGDTEIKQTITLPNLSCALLTDGCYFLRIRTQDTGTVSKLVEIKDDTDAVLITENFTNQEIIIRLTNEPSTVDLSITIDGTISSVDMFLFSALTVRESDPSSVTLPTSSDKGTLNDLYTTESSAIWFYTDITLVSSPTETRVFTVDHAAISASLGTRPIGHLLFLTGNNAGISRRVRTYTTGQIELFDALPFENTATDKVLLSLGCDKTILACGSLFNNSLNFRGEPYMPTQETLSTISET